MSELTPDDPAYERYQTLCAAIGGPPVEGYSRAVLARVAAWTTASEIDQLAYLVREHVGRSCQRYRGLVVEVAEHLTRTHPASTGEWTYTALSAGLAERIKEAAR